MATKYYAFDAAPGLLKRDRNSAALTASGYVGPTWDQLAPAATDGIMIVNVEALAATGEYTFRMVGYNDPGRSDATVLGTLEMGAASVSSVETDTSAVGDRGEIRFRTEKDDMRYQYIDLHLEVGGTAPSMTFSAYISREV
ncbi:hypothetical protein JANAI62_03730 [Jannaschia pagri]|uniref:Uncharacterized protein n=1 Tax=Jannaschia pagri TaxID=2829797 RepID=A0ABQ4NHT8_9RHOB|nr:MULTISPECIES: hypothetical protein [unclassified Jannaschia]GIT90144.1 hypothetical protein JANAI61_06020 [Jannaschia sp. AI_61]GIT93750.1 hypothetical protein JANAI62_03730 [Jannaschia sp. AI_62]